MKSKLLLLAIILVGAFSFNAEANRTKLHVASYDNAPIMVYINGVQYGPFSNRHKITNLQAGIHSMKVVAMYTPAYSRFNARKVIYAGPVHLTNGFEVHARIGPNHKLMIDRTVSMIHKQSILPVGVPIGNGVTCALPPSNNSLTSLLNHPNNTPQPGPIPVPVPVEPVGPIAVPDYDFNHMLQSIRSKSFDSTQKSIVRQLLSQHYFSSSQIRQLVGVFSFESSRVEVAQLAYHSVVDPYNYYMVYDAFHFESSIIELNRYISSL